MKGFLVLFVVIGLFLFLEWNVRKRWYFDNWIGRGILISLLYIGLLLWWNIIEFYWDILGLFDFFVMIVFLIIVLFIFFIFIVICILLL